MSDIEVLGFVFLLCLLYGAGIWSGLMMGERGRKQ